MKEILLIFREYSGTGFLTVLYLLALLYLWMTEKNVTVRAVFVYGASILQALFFFPLFYYGYQLLDAGTYYRILWLLPMSVTIAYAGTRILGKFPRFGIIFGLLLIAISGQCVYSNIYITKAENAYHIPQEVIEVCDLIMPAEGEERVTGVFPDELIHFVRQYSTRIQMAYGRDALVEDWTYGVHPLHEIMKKEELPVEELTKLATEYRCQYIILEKSKKLIGDFEKLQVYKLGETGNYDIYRNEQVDIIYIKQN